MTEPQQDSSELENSEQQAAAPEQTNSKTLPNKSPKSKSKRNKPQGRKPHSDRGSGRKPVTRSEYVRDSKGFKLSAEGLIRHFLGCRICCYFLTGAQVIYGRDVVDRMVHEFDGKWLTIPLGYETRKLMQQTYRLRLDQNEESIDFSCEVCCRRFAIDFPEVDHIVNAEELAKPDPDKDAEPDRFEVEEEALPTKRSMEANLQEWDEGNLPMMRVEFKHRR